MTTEEQKKAQEKLDAFKKELEVLVNIFQPDAMIMSVAFKYEAEAARTTVVFHGHQDNITCLFQVIRERFCDRLMEWARAQNDPELNAILNEYGEEKLRKALLENALDTKVEGV